MKPIVHLARFETQPTVFTATAKGSTRLGDFFSSHHRNPHTRRAYLEAVRQFSAFCADIGIRDLSQVEPVHVAPFVEAQLRGHSRPTVKQRLAAIRMLFDWMVVGQVIPLNPVHAVRGPRHSRNPAAPRLSEPMRRGSSWNRLRLTHIPACVIAR